VRNSRVILVAEDNPSDTILLKRAFFRANIRIPVVFLDDGPEYCAGLHEMYGLMDQNFPTGLDTINLSKPPAAGEDFDRKIS